MTKLSEIPGLVGGVLEGYLAQRRGDIAALSGVCADELVDQLSRLVLEGGKRLRPAFVWCGWQASGRSRATERAVLQVGAALELLQGCALIHDDLMDASVLRRGRPSVHHAFAGMHRDRKLTGSATGFGASAALLAGDLALVWAQDLWQESNLPGGIRERCTRLWRAMRAEMVTGQYLELSAQAGGACAPHEALRIAYLKAGLYTVQRPLVLGAALGGGGEPIRRALARAGESAGLAFQLRDDLLDLFGKPSRTGKPAGEDIRQGKPTYLVTVGLHNARAGGHASAAQVLSSALGNRDLTETGLERVRAALNEVGARTHVECLIDELVDEALEAVTASDMSQATAGDLEELIRRAAGVPTSEAAGDRPGVPGGEKT